MWHGCAKRSLALNQHVARKLPPPPAPSTVAATSLRDAVESLKSRCASLTSRFEAIESRLDSIETSFDSRVASFDNLTTRFTTNDTTLQSLVEAQQAVIASVTMLTEKLDSLANHLERVTIPSPVGFLLSDASPTDARVNIASSSGRRSLRRKVR